MNDHARAMTFSERADELEEHMMHELEHIVIKSALFNPGWQEQYGISYNDLMLPQTGERLTAQRFEELHKSQEPQYVVMFVNTQSAVDRAIVDPLTIIASPIPRPSVTVRKSWYCFPGPNRRS